ncbi:EamA family transporter [Actinokineospora sp. 24-640]
MIPLLGYAVLIAGTDVYAGHQLQSLNPITVGAISFTLAGVWFLGLDSVKHGLRTALRPMRTHRGDVIAINIMTAGAWLTLLYALKMLEPAVVNVVAFAIGPVLTVLLGPLLRKGSTVLRAEVLVAVGVVAALALLSWGSVSGNSGVGDIDTGQAVLGLALGFACGVACVGSVIYSKRLSDHGLTPLSSLSVRFFLMIVVSWALVATSDEPGIGPAFLPAALIAVIGVALPSYLGQLGIKYVEPITASLVDTLSPVFAFLLQLLDGRLTPSALTLACILAITVLVGIGVVARSRHETRTAALPPPLPIATPVESAPAVDRVA